MTTGPTGFVHVPVLRDRLVELVSSAAPRCILDCTVGGGGHAAALLSACPEAHLIGLDRDPAAIAAASRALQPMGDRARLVHAPFSDVRRTLSELGVRGVGGIIADLGVSSHQLDTPERGFSFQRAGPLDMRMDTSAGTRLIDVLARIDEKSLATALRDYGEERYARPVARAILDARPRDTLALARVVRSVVRPGADGIDPATRTFQGLRILVNGELSELDALLDAVPELLNDGGVVAIISFHSLEDRRVKHTLRRAAQGCICPPALPACMCGGTPTLEVLTRKPIRACPAEADGNPRARSARLRAARRLRRA